MAEYFSVAEEYSAELVIEKSRFISFIYPVSDAAKAAEKLGLLRKKYYDATHVCYAYICDGVIKFSDDGEPSDTAGQPILEVLKGNKLNNVLIAVVRYFGGTKLGTGGLVRAYTESALKVIAAAEIYPVAEVIYYTAQSSYKMHKSIRKLIADSGGVVTNEEFLESIKIDFFVQAQNAERLIDAILEATSGAAEFAETGRGKRLIK